MLCAFWKIASHRECAKTASFVWFSIHDIMVFVVILVRPLLLDGFIVSIVCVMFNIISISLHFVRRWYFVNAQLRCCLVLFADSLLFTVHGARMWVLLLLVLVLFLVVFSLSCLSVFGCARLHISKRYFLTKYSVADYFTKNFYFQFSWNSFSLRIVIIVCLCGSTVFVTHTKRSVYSLREEETNEKNI